MPQVDALLPEFDHEMAVTRKLLERVPEEKLDWRPHARSGTMGWLAGQSGWVRAGELQISLLSVVAAVLALALRPKDMSL